MFRGTITSTVLVFDRGTLMRTALYPLKNYTIVVCFFDKKTTS